MPKPLAPMWNREMETLPRARLEKLQLARWKELLARVYRKVPHYQRALDERGIDVARFKSLAQVAELPFTTKQDLRDNYPFGMLTEPVENIARLHASSGTTGKPTVGAYNTADLALFCRQRHRAALSHHPRARAPRIGYARCVD